MTMIQAQGVHDTKALPQNFLRQIIENDLHSGKYAHRKTPAGEVLPAVIMRFPPEPNGYLHIGHAKSICINFGLARDYGGICYLRFDDTNPEKEEAIYVDAIKESVAWLGFHWTDDQGRAHLSFASDYFEQLYQMAEYLITVGHAYVDSQSTQEIAQTRGDFTMPGHPSPYRARSPQASLHLFRQMRAGAFDEGAHVLRAKIDMASPNMNLRDPVIYRIRHARHHRTGDAWCIYPMYDYTHPICDALEQISHSVCTLEFQDHRPLYDWLLECLSAGGFFLPPLPQQYEFSRLNVTHTITSKRKLRQLVEEGIVDGWDDPRLPTLLGLRRRGFTPKAIRLFCQRTGISKVDASIDIAILEATQREVLEHIAPRAMVVLRPLKLVIDNFPQTFSQEVAHCRAPYYPPAHPEHESAYRSFLMSKVLWIEREDFMESPIKGYFRLFPGSRVRLRYGYVVECLGCEKDATGQVIAVHCQYFPDSKSGTPGSAQYKVKGNIHWVSAEYGLRREVRLYDPLYLDRHPHTDTVATLALNLHTKEVIDAYVEPTLHNVQPEDHFQFERHGYFVVDRWDSKASQPVFNRTVTLKDRWKK